MLRLTILSPERRLLQDEEVDEVTIKGNEGQLQILPGHAPMVGTLESGAFSFRGRDGRLSSGVISSGFFEIHDDHLTVIAETLELQGEIDLDRAVRAQRQAEEILKEADLDEHRFRKY